MSPQAIRYPTDLNLLNEGFSEQLIDILYSKLGWKKKPLTYREKARKAYLAIVKQRRPADLSATRLRRLAGSCLHLVRQSYETGGITNDPGRATILRQQGHHSKSAEFEDLFRSQVLTTFRGKCFVMGVKSLSLCSNCP